MLSRNNGYASIKGLYSLKTKEGFSDSQYFNILSKFTLCENLYKYIFVLQIPIVMSCAKDLFTISVRGGGGGQKY